MARRNPYGQFRRTEPRDEPEYTQVSFRRNNYNRFEEKEKPKETDKIQRKWIVRPDRDAVSLVLRVEAESDFMRELADMIEDCRGEFVHAGGKCVPVVYEIIPLVYLDDDYRQFNLCLTNACLEKEVQLKFTRIRARKSFLVAEVEFSSYLVKLLDRVISPFSHMEVACEAVPLLRMTGSLPERRMETYLEALNARGYEATTKLKSLTLVRKEKLYKVRANHVLASWEGLLTEEDDWLPGIVSAVSNLVNEGDIEALTRTCDFVNSVARQAREKKEKVSSEEEDERVAPWSTPARNTVSLRQAMEESDEDSRGGGAATKLGARPREMKTGEGSRSKESSECSDEFGALHVPDYEWDNSLAINSKLPSRSFGDVAVLKPKLIKANRSSSQSAANKTMSKESKLAELTNICKEYIDSPDHPDVDKKEFLQRLSQATAGLYPSLKPLAEYELAGGKGDKPSGSPDTSADLVVKNPTEPGKQTKMRENKLSDNAPGQSDVDQIMKADRYTQEPVSSPRRDHQETESDNEYSDVSEEVEGDDDGGDYAGLERDVVVESEEDHSTVHESRDDREKRRAREALKKEIAANRRRQAGADSRRPKTNRLSFKTFIKARRST